MNTGEKSTPEKIGELVKGNDVLNSTKNNLDELPKEPKNEEGKKSAENSVDEVRFLFFIMVRKILSIIVNH